MKVVMWENEWLKEQDIDFHMSSTADPFSCFIIKVWSIADHINLCLICIPKNWLIPEQIHTTDLKKIMSTYTKHHTMYCVWLEITQIIDRNIRVSENLRVLIRRKMPSALTQTRISLACARACVSVVEGSDVLSADEGIMWCHWLKL